MSLDKLIRLAKRTGDRLIVHNPMDETDVVIMGIDEYENLLDEKQDDFFGSANDVRGLSERELLNQINRDISIWRANDKLEGEYEDEFSATGAVPAYCMGPASGWDFGKSKSDWHGVGSVLENKELEDFDANSFVESLAGKEEENAIEEINLEDMNSFDDLQKTAEKEEIKEVILTDLPQMKNQSAGLILDDEPVFYEEPV